MILTSFVNNYPHKSNDKVVFLLCGPFNYRILSIVLSWTIRLLGRMFQYGHDSLRRQSAFMYTPLCMVRCKYSLGKQLFSAPCLLSRFYCDSSHRNSSVPAIAGYRLTTGLSRRADLRPFRTAFRPPELAQPGAHAAGSSSQTTAIVKRTRCPGGGERYAHSQQRCEISRHSSDSGKEV